MSQSNNQAYLDAPRHTLRFGEAVFFWRKKLKLSQEKFAEKLGVCKRTIPNWEAAWHPPNRPAWKSVAAIIVERGWLTRYPEVRIAMGIPTEIAPAKGYTPRMTTAITTLKEITDIAHAIENSRLIPNKYRKRPHDLIAIGLLGKGLNLDIWEAMRSLHVIEGVPTLSAQLMMGLAMRHCPTANFKYEEGEGFCRIKARRSPDDLWSTFEYNMEDARTAGLLSKKNWRENPRAMLLSRVQSKTAKALFPDCLAGVYTAEEINPNIAVDSGGEVIVDAKAQVIEHPNEDDRFESIAKMLEKYLGVVEAEVCVQDLRNVHGDEGAMELILHDLSPQVKQAKEEGKNEDAIGDCVRGWFAGRRARHEDATSEDEETTGHEGGDDS